jgi:hypothetical protein
VLEAKAYTWSSEITFENKSITIVGMGNTTLDRQLGGRFFTINSGGHVTVKHLTITGGGDDDSATLTHNGVVAFVGNGGTFNAHDCTISENAAVRDGCCGGLKIV